MHIRKGSAISKLIRLEKSLKTIAGRVVENKTYTSHTEAQCLSVGGVPATRASGQSRRAVTVAVGSVLQ